MQTEGTQASKEQQFKVRDLRKRDHFVIDDVFMDAYSRILGTTTSMVYAWLCRYSNKDQQAWPSLATMGDNMAISERTVRRSIETLKRANILSVKRLGKMRTNRYNLIDKSEWMDPETLEKQLKSDWTWMSDHIAKLNGQNDVQSLSGQDDVQSHRTPVSSHPGTQMSNHPLFSPCIPSLPQKGELLLNGKESQSKVLKPLDMKSRGSIAPVFADQSGPNNGEKTKSDFQKFVDHVLVSWASVKNVAYPMNGSHGKIIKQLLSRYPLPMLQGLWDIFMSRKWSYVDETGETVIVPHDVFKFQKKFTVLLEYPEWKELEQKYLEKDPDAVDQVHRLLQVSGLKELPKEKSFEQKRKRALEEAQRL